MHARVFSLSNIDRVMEEPIHGGHQSKRPYIPRASSNHAYSVLLIGLPKKADA